MYINLNIKITKKEIKLIIKINKENMKLEKSKHLLPFLTSDSHIS